MNTADVVVWVLVGMVGCAALVVAGIVVILGLIVRRILLRIERTLVEVDDARAHVVRESERLLIAAGMSASRVMQFALALAGALLARGLSERTTHLRTKKNEKH